MVYSARLLALLLALTIAAVTTAFLSLVQGVDVTALIVTFLIAFAAAYIFIFVVLEFLIFREINSMNKVLSRLKKQELEGLQLPKSGRLNPLKNINDEIISFSQLKQKEIDELRKLERFRKDFVANISHELKTPIFAAQGFVHTLLDGAVKDKNVRTKFLRRAAKSLDGLDILVQDLLTLSQIESGDITMKFSYFDMRKLCEEILDQFEDKAEKRKIRLMLQRTPEALEVYGDPKRIVQVMNNLISNALNHTAEKGLVKISFEPGKKYLTVLVSDDGCGIPQEHLPRIFERFYRIDWSRSRERGGTGLGLAIVKHVLDSHQSKIEVSSQVGKGSIFSFRLLMAGEA